MSGLTVVARIVAKKDSVEAVHGALLEILEPTRKEEGCIAYNLFRDTDNPAAFVMLEKWESAGHLDRHMATPHFAALGAAIDGKVEGLTISKLTQVD
ncbi:MAG: putative quinol monooxygenase [FCB group bacterium]|jgi:quinol monooxygenase YgiN|nr:putative quinol monooxygenase [FCB group bacterium]